MRKRKFCRKNIFCRRKDFAPQLCGTELKKKEAGIREVIADINGKKLGWVLKKWKNRDKTSKFCHNGSRVCLIFFNNKRRRHTLLRIVFSSAEKRNGTVLKQPHSGTVYLHFQNSTVPLPPFPANF
jgi:hypothetical protein